METEIKYPPLQKAWERRKHFTELARKMNRRGNATFKEAEKHRVIKGLDVTHGSEWPSLYQKAHDYWNRAHFAWKQGEAIWRDAVKKHYGLNVKVTWRYWHKDNEPTCHVGSDVYV